MEIPPISLLTPIFDRNKFLNLMICNISCFDYPRELITWEILDSKSKDGKKGKKLFENQEQINFLQKDLGIHIKYTYLDKPMQIGEKRNYLSKNADNKIMINMDSDDIMFPSYLKFSVMNLKQQRVGLTGSNQMLFYDVKNEKFYAISCSALRQLHEASFCYTKKHWKKMGGYETNSQGEGCKMIDGMWEKNIANLPIEKLMICVCHPENTIDKEKFLQGKTEIRLHPQMMMLPHFQVAKNIVLGSK